MLATFGFFVGISILFGGAILVGSGRRDLAVFALLLAVVGSAGYLPAFMATSKALQKAPATPCVLLGYLAAVLHQLASWGSWPLIVKLWVRRPGYAPLVEGFVVAVIMGALSGFWAVRRWSGP